MTPNTPVTTDAQTPVYSRWLIMVSMVFVTCLITANIAAVKLIQIGGYILDAGVITFPVSYIVGDVLTEVYGYRQARQVIWLGFFCNLLAVGALWLGGLLPAPDFWDGQQAYQRILGYTPRLLLASFLAYLCGEFANAFILARMKIATQGRWLWARTIGSTIVGEGLDSAIFILVAFTGSIPPTAMVSAIAAQWVFKTVYEAAMTPVTYRVVHFLKHRDGRDAYDHATRFNPFLILD